MCGDDALWLASWGLGAVSRRGRWGCREYRWYAKGRADRICRPILAAGEPGVVVNAVSI